MVVSAGMGGFFQNQREGIQGDVWSFRVVNFKSKQPYLASVTVSTTWGHPRLLPVLSREECQGLIRFHYAARV